MCRVCLNLSSIIIIRKAGMHRIIKANLYAKIIVVLLQRAMPFYSVNIIAYLFLLNCNFHVSRSRQNGCFRELICLLLFTLRKKNFSSALE